MSTVPNRAQRVALIASELYGMGIDPRIASELEEAFDTAGLWRADMPGSTGNRKDGSTPITTPAQPDTDREDAPNV